MEVSRTTTAALCAVLACVGGCTRTVSAPARLAVVDYDLALDLDTPPMIRGAATLTVDHGGAEPAIHLNFLDLAVDSVRVDDTRVAFRRSVTEIEIPLPSGRRRSKVSVYYRGTPTDGLIIRRDSAGRWTAFGDNWPTRARHWIPSIDDPSDKATVTWTVRAPAQETVVANGVLVYQKPIAGPDGGALTETQWRESHPIAPYLMVVAVAPLRKLDLGCARVGDQCIPQSVYAAPEQYHMLPGAFARATDIVAYFTRLIGPFPYEKLAHLQSSTRYGGMENATAIFYADGPFRSSPARFAAFASTVAHETAHQWFGDAVTEREWSHVWLSEGFATYFAALWDHEANGDASFRSTMRRMRETVLADTVSVTKRPVIDTAESDLMALLNRNSYEKGGFVLHMLRGQVGDSAFFSALRHYYAAHRDGNALTADLQAEMERASGQRLDWFFDQWLRRPGFPTVTAEWSYDPGARAVVIQAWQDQRFGAYRVPVVIEAADSSGVKRRATLELRAVAGDTVRGAIALGSAPREVTIDPDVSILASLALRARR